MLSESTFVVGQFAEHLGEWCKLDEPCDEVTLVTSLLEPRISPWGGQDDKTEWHAPVLDIDIDHIYYPSTTPGHAALLLNVQLKPDLYWKLINVLEECRIIEPGFAEASRQRGYSACRTPWTKKPLPPECPDGCY